MTRTEDVFRQTGDPDRVMAVILARMAVLAAGDDLLAEWVANLTAGEWASGTVPPAPRPSDAGMSTGPRPSWT